jgi:TldD protein
VLLHEAVAHALESDLPELGAPVPGHGERLGSAALSVVDDPTTAPQSVRRATDDEGSPVLRRFLLREGAVDQPLADLAAAADSEALLPGAARRASRHGLPAPRSTHLELLPGERSEAQLQKAAAGGLLVTEASRGRLDPRSRRFRLEVPHARRLGADGPGEAVGAFRLAGRVEEILGRVAEIGVATAPTAGGWCAKGGLKVPVWATAASVLLDGVEVMP